MISYLATLFLGKSLGGSLPVFSAHSFASYLNLLFLKQWKTEKFLQNECATCKQSGHTTDPGAGPGFHLYAQNIDHLCINDS